ncbi:hypothetical protein PRUB_a3442 [Pseudoalteromonas rubra]|uniref:Uncharacterized protein n=1 Tax=Pseudoalteromonas rubra TaxID=43658 RepID=A0A8T0C3K2_9GAMM|nr:hypothetical protein PRUB_a3442 [Pseudoalteromonas rubra]
MSVFIHSSLTLNEYTLSTQASFLLIEYLLLEGNYEKNI